MFYIFFFKFVVFYLCFKQCELLITDDGSATFNANFEPAEALLLKDHLMEILNKGIVLSSHFHLLYAVVPSEVTINIDWNVFHSEVLFYKKLFLICIYICYVLV